MFNSLTTYIHSGVITNTQTLFPIGTEKKSTKSFIQNRIPKDNRRAVFQVC